MKATLINAIHKKDSFTDKETGALVEYDNFEIHAIKVDDKLGQVCIVGTIKAKDCPNDLYNYLGETVNLDVIAKNGGRYKFESIERR